MSNITINNKILLDLDYEYLLSDSPQILRDYFAEALHISKQEAEKNFSLFNDITFEFEYTCKTSFSQLKEIIYSTIGIDCEADRFSEGVELAKFHIWTGSLLICIDNDKYKICEFIRKYNINNIIKCYMIYPGTAGDIWRDDGLRYYMQSKEQGKHNEPHLHIDYRHERFGTINLKNGDMLEGNLTDKLQKKVKKKVLENQEFLLKYWNEHTDGLTVDLNLFFKQKPVIQIK